MKQFKQQNLNIINPTAKFPNQNVTDKILKKELLSDDNNNQISDNNNVVFEFRNEITQGRNINNLEDKKTKLALSAVQKMFKNLSTNNINLNLKDNEKISTLSRYFMKQMKM